MDRSRERAPSPEPSQSPVPASREGPARRREAGLLLVAVAVAAGALTVRWWLPGVAVLLGFLEANDEAIGVLADLATIFQFLGVVAALVLGFLGLRRVVGGGAEEAAAPAHAVAQGEGNVYAGRDIVGPVIAGDRNVLRVEMGEELYERLRSDAAPASLGVAPPVPEAFVGREGDVAELKGRLRQATRDGDAPVQVLTAVHGWPGVGKTALAAKLVHDEEVRGMFPDGVLFASLGQEPDVLSTIVSWGRSLGVGDLSDAETVAEASGRLRAAMLDTRALLVLDDVWETAHALPLAVGGRRCGTVATTRLDRVARELSPRAEGVYRLEVLSEEEALELLEQLAPGVVENHPSEGRELVRELDGLPLAVRIAGGLLAAEASAGLDVPGLLEELREGRRLLEEEAPSSYALLLGQVPLTVAALLCRSTDRLRPLYRRRFALLGVLPPHPVSFDTPAAQDVWAMNSDPRMTLRALLDRGLIEPAGDGRFQIHSLLSAFAASMIEEDPELPSLREVQLRRLRHYEVKLGAANEAFLLGGRAQRDWLGVFDADWEGIRAAYLWAASLMEEDEEAADYVNRYAGVGSSVLAFRLPPREFIRWMELALRAARRLEDAESVVTRKANLGTGYLMAGAYPEALPYFEEALADARAAEDRHGEAPALGNLASTYSALGDTDRAVACAEECVTVAREIGDRGIEAKALGTLGEIYAELGRPRDAVRCLKGQKDVAHEIEHAPSEARAMRKLGIFYRELGHPWRAAVFFEAAASAFEDLDDREALRGVLLSHGILCAKQEAYEDALGLFDRVLESAEGDGDGAAGAPALMNQGNVRDAQGLPDLAEDLYRRAIDAARDGGHAGTLGDASWNLAQLLEAKGDRRGAVGAARDAAGAYRSVGNPNEERVLSWLRDQGVD